MVNNMANWHIVIFIDNIKQHLNSTEFTLNPI